MLGEKIERDPLLQLVEKKRIFKKIDPPRKLSWIVFGPIKKISSIAFYISKLLLRLWTEKIWATKSISTSSSDNIWKPLSLSLSTTLLREGKSNQAEWDPLVRRKSPRNLDICFVFMSLHQLWYPYHEASLEQIK